MLLRQLTELQEQVLSILEKYPGVHYLGPDLSRLLGISPRKLRVVIRALRFNHGRWDILSRAGGNVITDGYWVSNDPVEIENNRHYHERQGLDHLKRASHMTAKKTPRIDSTTGQFLMEFAPAG